MADLHPYDRPCGDSARPSSVSGNSNAARCPFDAVLSLHTVGCPRETTLNSAAPRGILMVGGARKRYRGESMQPPIEAIIRRQAVAADNGVKKALTRLEDKRSFFDVSAEDLKTVDPYSTVI